MGTVLCLGSEVNPAPLTLTSPLVGQGKRTMVDIYRLERQALADGKAEKARKGIISVPTEERLYCLYWTQVRERNAKPHPEVNVSSFMDSDNCSMMTRCNYV